MSWWGKVIGGAFGFMVGGPLGALLGAALGHNFDAGMRRRMNGSAGEDGLAGLERTQTAFFTATFAVMGRLAKADGRVSEDEIRMAKTIMDRMALNAQLRQAAQRLFQEGKQPGFPLDEVLDQLRRECHRRHSLLRMFVEIQFQAAFADGVLHPHERELLWHVCDRLGFSRHEFNAIEAMVRTENRYRQGPPRKPQRLSLEDAYTLLEVPPNADAATVKKAYRRQMSRHHPDKLVSKGLPEEMIKVATEKTQDIKAAYERIRDERGLG